MSLLRGSTTAHEAATSKVWYQPTHFHILFSDSVGFGPWGLSLSNKTLHVLVVGSARSFQEFYTTAASRTSMCTFMEVLLLAENKIRECRQQVHFKESPIYDLSGKLSQQQSARRRATIA